MSILRLCIALVQPFIKGRGPTLRHVSRTDRVGLDLLFDWINLDPVTQSENHRRPKPTRITHGQMGQTSSTVHHGGSICFLPQSFKELSCAN